MTRLPAGASTMWLASLAGTALGLAIDCRTIDLDALAGLCTAGNGVLAGLLRHLSLLPATNLGMLSGGLLALVFVRSGSLASVAANVLCNLFMLAGMGLAACLGSKLAAELGVVWNAPAMLAAMTAGMTAGMLAAVVRPQLTIRALLYSPSPPFRGERAGVRWV